MSVVINNVTLKADDKEFLLFNVTTPSSDEVGVCPVSPFVTSVSDGLPYTEALYIGKRPVLIFNKPFRGDRYSDKLVTQISHPNDQTILRRFSYATENYFTLGQMMLRSLTPVMEILSRGLYVVHISRMIPTDGMKNFFLNAYSIRREIRGTAEINSVIGEGKNHSSPFLIPTQTINQYSEQKYNRMLSLMNTEKNVGGLALHVSGLFCALLDGHHAAMASTMREKPFNCIVIEPVRNVIYESENIAKAEGRSPRVVALSCPYVKIPLDVLPPEMLEDFLTTRRESIPASYPIINAKLKRNLRTIARKKYEPGIYEKTRFYPDVSIIESANAIDMLTEEDLEALLNGKTTNKNGRTIISENHYNSIVTACNYLQYKDFRRLMIFAEEILLREELKALHGYIVERLTDIPLNDRVYKLFLKIFGVPKREVEPQKRSFKSVEDIINPLREKTISTEQKDNSNKEKFEFKETTNELESALEGSAFELEQKLEEKRLSNGFYDLKERTDRYIIEYESMQTKKRKQTSSTKHAIAAGLSSDTISALQHDPIDLAEGLKKLAGD